MSEVRSMPCSACPYRRDVPPGVWEHAEYEKLRPYDNETGEQPLATFRCHATPEHLCHGWAVVHSNRGHDRELLALRFWPCEVPEAGVPLFESGNEAADHGQSGVTKEAFATAARLVRKYERLR